jgi:uracil-DNA glycosylase
MLKINIIPNPVKKIAINIVQPKDHKIGIKIIETKLVQNEEQKRQQDFIREKEKEREDTLAQIDRKTSMVVNTILLPDIPRDVDIYSVAMSYTPPGWVSVFNDRKKEIKHISDQLSSKGELITPENCMIFNAFHLTPLIEVRVVIIGQDPYPAQGVANGLAFSTNSGGVPASLRNIYKEISNCYPEYVIPDNGDLENWARQGVFLINTCLTCPVGNSAGHSKYNIWISFISYVLGSIGLTNRDCFYLLWGKHAQSCKQYIKGLPDRILTAAHPSPLSAKKGFFGCEHFKIVNKKLRPQIVW